MTLNWNATKEERELFSRIAQRAIEDFPAHALRATKMDLMMDVQAVHCNGCPLKLQELLDAPPFDFAHDLAGIYRHLNRETGELEDFFLPRFAAPESERQALGES